LILTAWQYGMRGVIVFCIGYAGLSFVGRDQAFVDLFGFASVLLINLMRTIGFLLIGYMVAQLMAEQRKRREALAEANHKLVRFASTLEQLSSSRERIRLAHELHDTLAHTQSALAVQLEGVDALWHNEPDEAHALLQKSVANTRAGMVETRRALQALRASPLDELGLVLAIGELAESAAARGGFQLSQSLPKQIDTISPDIEQCLYRTAQEALENIVRHAQAEHVSLSLDQSASGVRLVVQDDGTGFDAAVVDRESSFGLRGMDERARMVSGNLKIDSQPGQGTCVCLLVEDYHDSRTDL
jgi:signal transduction histidine kinase